MLWSILKSKMMAHPRARIHEGADAITYEEAVVRAENFARGLAAPCYAVLCGTEIGTSLALLSCLAAGKTAVPLSYRYGEIHCRRILEFVCPRYIIGEEQGELRITEIENQRYEEPDGHPALIMCTSGTTGAPKGVMLTETNLLVNVRDILRYFALSERDRILISRPLYHSAVLTGEFLTSLMCGTEIYFQSQSFHMREYVRLMEEEKITVACATPSFFQMVGSFAAGPLPASKLAVSGECLTREVATRIRRAFPDAEIYHVYGLTEAAPRVAYLSPACFDTMPEMLSCPLRSVRLKIVDEKGIEVSEGKEGELLVSGENVMAGYYRNPALTKQTLVDGWLHTGDMAVKNRDGTIRILGRRDDMILYAGMNIYPREIEDALKKDARVEEVLAYGIPSPYSGQAVAVKVKGNFKDRDEVAALCRACLPAYERPARVELMEELPKNASGKLLRR